MAYFLSNVFVKNYQNRFMYVEVTARRTDEGGTFLGKQCLLEMWANAQRDGRPAAYRWRPHFYTAKFG